MKHSFCQWNHSDCSIPWFSEYHIQRHRTLCSPLDQEGASTLGDGDPAADIQNLYARNGDKFNGDISALVGLDTASGKQSVRIFSLRGAHLLGILAKTDQAKAFRHRELNVLTQKDNSIDYIAPSSQMSCEMPKFNVQSPRQHPVRAGTAGRRRRPPRRAGRHPHRRGASPGRLTHRARRKKPDSVGCPALSESPRLL